MTAYEQLIAKINEFTQKFYLNKLLRGSIFACASILGLYLLLFVGIYFLHPGIAVKTGLFFLFVSVSGVALVGWLLLPALSYFKLKKNITPKTAAKLIGLQFFNIKDRLLNTLQLKELAQQQPENAALIMAGIEQKIAELKPIPFTNAINLAENKRHLRYLALPVSIILLIGLLAPVILKEGTQSFIRYNQVVLHKAPFRFVVQNKNLNVLQGDDLTLSVALKGNQLPQDVYVADGSNTHKLEKKDIAHFVYTFKNLQSNKVLQLTGGGFSSSPLKITVNPRPSLLNINAQLVFPRYLNRKDQNIPNAGDLTMPQGTVIKWNIRAENTNTVHFLINKRVYQLPLSHHIAQHSAKISQTTTYQLVPKNKYGSATDAITYQLTVIPDQYPTISLTETPDSLSQKLRYFTGKITDDYGFSALRLKYQVIDGSKTIKTGVIPIPINKSQTEIPFFFPWDLSAINLKPGQQLVYFFEAADNDGVNGPKTVRSDRKTYNVPTQNQAAAQVAKDSKKLTQKIQSALKLANTIQHDSKKLGESLLDKNAIGFEDKKRIEDLLNKQQKLQQNLTDIKNLNEQNNFKKDENDFLNQELKERQKQLDNLFNNMLDEKTKALLEKLQQLLDANQKDRTQEQLKNMQMDNKQLKNELDRLLDLYKQLDFEQNLQNKIDRLNQLAKQQQNLAKQTLDKSQNKDELQQKQDELQNQFNQLKQELKQLDQQNQSLSRPNNFKNPEQQADQISNNQQESKNQLQKNNRNQAAQQQQQAAQNIEKMAQQMDKEQQQGEDETAQINEKELRRLLENLLNTSFEQEKAMLLLKKTQTNDPNYVNIARNQNTIKENMGTITDSLRSLSKRVPQIETTVSKELENINLNIEKAIENLSERQSYMAAANQQFAMTAMNNLALMLNEALEQMRNQKDGGGKGKKQSMKQLQQMQEQLSKNMQQAKEQMQKQGNKGTVPRGQQSQQFAKMAQQQQAIRNALEKLNKEQNPHQKGNNGNLGQMIQEMKKTENDLVNKRITEEMIRRQKNLTIKLLEAEKAERNQEEDNKRDANAPKQFPPQYQQMLQNFNKETKSETESLRQLPLNLNHYYKSKVAEYFKLLNSPK